MAWKDLLTQIVAGIMTAIVIAVASIAWNWASEGGLIRLLGGVTKSEVKAQLESFTTWPKETTQNGTTMCKDGEYLVGMQFQSEGGLQHGALWAAEAVCRKLGPEIKLQ